MHADTLTMRCRVRGSLSLKRKYESDSPTVCHWMENMFDYDEEVFFDDEEMEMGLKFVSSCGVRGVGGGLVGLTPQAKPGGYPPPPGEPCVYSR